MMFKRRDIPPVLLLLLLIILVMLTLSQILVVHNGRYGKNIHSLRRLQLELRDMDVNLNTMMLQNVPSIELNRRLIQSEINARHVATIIEEAGQPDSQFVPDLEFVLQFSVTQSAAHEFVAPDISVDMTPLSDYKPSKHMIDSDSDVRESISNRRISTGADANEDEALFLKPHLTVSELVTQSSLDDLFHSNVESAPVVSNISGVDISKSYNHIDPAVTRTRNVYNQSSSLFNPVNISVLSNTTDTTLVLNHFNLSHDRMNVTKDLRVTESMHARTSECNRLTKSDICYCPPVPPLLTGKVFLEFEHTHEYKEEDIVAQNPELQSGGQWRPHDCVARHKVAVIVPYRDRSSHLIILLSHLHQMLQRQQLDYRIYVVEQSGQYTFNKARIMNIAFVEALKQYGFQCFVFHDVDLVPEDDRNMYSCPIQPRHMSVAIDEMGYKLAYQELVGGVLNMRTDHFQRVNGYSNLYWGWGAEDDDMAYRIMYVGLKITRPPDSIARYKMIQHTKRKPSDWRKRAKLLYTGTRRFQFDGLNSLQYKLISIKNFKLFTHILVDIGKPPRGF